MLSLVLERVRVVQERDRYLADWLSFRTGSNGFNSHTEIDQRTRRPPRWPQHCCDRRRYPPRSAVRWVATRSPRHATMGHAECAVTATVVVPTSIAVPSAQASRPAPRSSEAALPRPRSDRPQAAARWRRRGCFHRGRGRSQGAVGTDRVADGRDRGQADARGRSRRRGRCAAAAEREDGEAERAGVDGAAPARGRRAGRPAAAVRPADGCPGRSSRSPGPPRPATMRAKRSAAAPDASAAAAILPACGSGAPARPPRTSISAAARASPRRAAVAAYP